MMRYDHAPAHTSLERWPPRRTAARIRELLAEAGIRIDGDAPGTCGFSIARFTGAFSLRFPGAG